MTDEVWTISTHAGVLVILCAVAVLITAEVRWRWLAGAFFLFVLYKLALTRFFWEVPSPFPQLAGNWEGAGAALLLLLLVAALPGVGWRRTGLTLRQRGGVIVPLLIVVALAAGLAWVGLRSASDANPELVLYEGTINCLDEELFYRGVLLLALNEAFRGRVTVLGAPIGWGGVVATLLFAAVHGLGWQDGTFVPYAEEALAALLLGALLLWLRERTGSLLFPTLTHSAAGGIGMLL